MTAFCLTFFIPTLHSWHDNITKTFFPIPIIFGVNPSTNYSPDKPNSQCWHFCDGKIITTFPVTKISVTPSRWRIKKFWGCAIRGYNLDIFMCLTWFWISIPERERERREREEGGRNSALVTYLQRQRVLKRGGEREDIHPLARQQRIQLTYPKWFQTL